MNHLRFFYYPWTQGRTIHNDTLLLSKETILGVRTKPRCPAGTLHVCRGTDKPPDKQSWLYKDRQWDTEGAEIDRLTAERKFGIPYVATIINHTYPPRIFPI